MTDYPELYRQLAREILKHEGKITGDARAFVAELASRLKAEGFSVTSEIEAQLTDYLGSMQAAIRDGIGAAVELSVGAISIARAGGRMNSALQSEVVVKLAQQAFDERWPDGLKLSDRLWNWDESARKGLTNVLRDAAKTGESVNKTVYAMQRTIERAAGGQRFKIVEQYADDWVRELHESAVAMIHDPSARESWQTTVSEVEDRILSLKTTGTRSAAERVFSQIKLAVEKGREELADKAVKWWLYDKQLYALKRIARTEMATAMHRAVIDGTQDDETVIGYQWRLSASHPVTDICDYYANVEMGLGRGVFTKDAVPHHKAHPHCMCLLIPRATPIKQKGSKDYAGFIKNLSPEQRKTMLPQWAKQVVESGIPLEKLIRPDGLGLVTRQSAATAGMIDSDWKALGLPPAKQLHALPGVVEPAPKLAKTATTVDGALSDLRKALGMRTGERKTVKTPAGQVVIDDSWLPHVVEKRDAARERYGRWIMPTLEAPTEVWQAPYGDSETRTRYIKLFSENKSDMLVVVNVTKGELLWNVIPMPTRSLDNQRRGRLLWKSYQQAKG